MKRKNWLIPLAFLLTLIGALVVYGLTPARPMPQALAALQSDSRVMVTAGKWLELKPANSDPDTALVFYPGGRVDYRAYAPLARAVAEQGYRVVIVPMPFSLAVFAPGKAADVMAAYPQVQHWAVGGHSLGGAMAANFVHQNPGAVEGLLFLAAYPTPSNSLVNSDVQVVSIYAANDGLATQDDIAESRAYLPEATQWIEINGGNHAQFGWYGSQNGDGVATISREDQQQQAAMALIELLRGLED